MNNKSKKQAVRSNPLFKNLESFISRLWLHITPATAHTPFVPGIFPGKKGLIIKTCCMGDSILSLYAIRDFLKNNPDTSVDVLCSFRVEEVYKSFQGINNIYVIPLKGKSLIFEVLKPALWVKALFILFKLRREKYEYLVDMELYHGYPLIIKSLCNIPFSMGFKVESAPPKKHDVLVTRLKDIPEWLCFYHLFQDKRAAEFTPPLLFHKSSRKVGSNFRIGIVFGSSFNWPQKRWPLNNFIEVIKTFKKACHEIILFGTLDEAKDAQYIIDKCFASIINTTGMLTFSDLKSEVSHCDIILGNDTGTMHLAAALGIPTITLFGPTNPAKWNPLTSTAVTSQENCSPCYYLSSMPNCPHINCMKNILPERVAQILKEKLALLESCQGNQFNTN